MKTRITFGSKHPAVVSDRAFFVAHPRRRFRARKLWLDELGLPSDVLLFAPGERGEVSEINLVILDRFEGGRFRYHFVKPARLPLNSDAKIEAFLRSRGISPVRRNRAGRSA